MALLVSGLITSCDKEDDNMNTTPAGISSTSTDNSGTQSDPGNAVGRMAEDMISGKYTVMKFVENGQDMTSIYTGVTVEYGDNNIMYAFGPNFEYKGVYGVDMQARIMKMQIAGNDLMMMLSGNYRIIDVKEGRVYLESEDGKRSFVLGQARVVFPFTGPVPKIIVPGRQ